MYINKVQYNNIIILLPYYKYTGPIPKLQISKMIGNTWNKKALFTFNVVNNIKRLKDY